MKKKWLVNIVGTLSLLIPGLMLCSQDSYEIVKKYQLVPIEDYFGQRYSIIQEILQYIPTLSEHDIDCPYLRMLHSYVDQQKEHAPVYVLEGVLQEIMHYIDEASYVLLSERAPRPDGSPVAVPGNCDLNDIIQLLVDIDQKISNCCQRSTDTGFVMKGCQPGSLTLGTSDATPFSMVTQCIDRLTIDVNGGVTIAAPMEGEVALTIVGGGETITSGTLNIVEGNIILPQANSDGTQGLLQLGGTSGTNVNVYEVGTRNFFAGGGLVTTGVTGSDTINIGTNANSSLTTANNVIGIGNNVQVTGVDSIGIGGGPIVTPARAIAIGSRDSTATGVAPFVTQDNGIAIGSASGLRQGASASESAVAVGGSDGSFQGAAATGSHSISIGVNASSSAPQSIGIGSASGAGGGRGPKSSNINSIAIGSGGGLFMGGAAAEGAASIAIGSADPSGTFAGSFAFADRSIAIGANAQAVGPSAIVVGSCSADVGGPSVNSDNGIAIGSANGLQAGAVVNGLSSIAIGSANTGFQGAQTSASYAIAVGVNAGASAAQAIAIGSASDVAAGAQANNTGAIALGSGGGFTMGGATSTGLGSIAIGSADPGNNAPGASAGGDRSIAMGINAQSFGAGSVVVGSASADPLGFGPLANGDAAIAIGSARGFQGGPIAAGIGAVALGSSDGISLAAQALADRAVAIGCGSNASSPDTIILGDITSPVRVGIGTNLPSSRLHVVGADGLSVVTFDQVTDSITNAPVWLNPSTSGAAGTPIHYDNGTGQLFGFTSSERYKKNIRKVDQESAKIYDLQPVIYDTKPGHGDRKNISGFIAEQVYEVAPELVLLNREGQPENIAYNSLHALAICEIQKHEQKIHEQANSMRQLDSVIATLERRVQELEKMLQEDTRN